MASTEGLLLFLRGADFSHNYFRGENFPHSINQMKGLKWLKLSRTQLDWIPEEFAAFDKLDTLNLSHNNLTSLHGELICLNNLKYLDCRHNKISGEHIPVELFNIKSLTVLDLSHNNLTVIPNNLENCTSLTVLNLSHNNIRNISENLFIQLTGLLHLDLSDNELRTLPPQIGRLTKLKTLILNNNPLEEHKMRQIERIKSLQVLHLANTHRNSNNTPSNLGDLTNLVELNLSSNQLLKVPSELTNLRELRRLYLSENLIEKMPEDFGNWWPNLETLNLSSNSLKELSPSLCKLCNLKRLYLNDNRLTFAGLPAALGRLHQLEIFMAAGNNLELIPESIFRCGRLKKLILSSNKLITLPDTIHLLYDLEVLDLSNNPDLMMPPKPMSESQRNSLYYNIDFSLKTQLRLAGDPNIDKIPQQPSSAIKDPIARKLRLRKRAKDEVEETNQAKVLKGMNDLVLDKYNIENKQSNFLETDLKPKRWDEILERPPIDYSDYFDETTGQIQGLTIWEIDNISPTLVDSNLHGKFYLGDCYIILSTTIDENLSLNWKIFYWIGPESSTDKKAGAAIHAVGLRNHINAQCRTVREESGEESDEFLGLFPDGIDYVEGARTASGFYTVEEPEYEHRMFRLHEVAEKSRQLHLETVALSSNSLDSRFVFLIDLGSKILIWNGMKSKNTIRQRARLLGEKFNKEERKNKAELIFCEQGDEPMELLEEFELTDPLPKVPFKTIDLSDDFEIDSYQPRRPILYQITIGVGYIELTQVSFKYGELLSKYLVASNAYILDSCTDVFVWLGRKSSKLVRNAALRVAQELFSMLKRPKFATITSCIQGTESQLFKTKFKEWDDVIAVDYTRTAESVSRTGADLTKWMSEQKVKIDLAALFAPPRVAWTEEQTCNLIEDLDSELVSIDIRVLSERGFLRIPPEEFGHFYSEDCYAIECKYYESIDDSASSDEHLVEDEEQVKPINGTTNGHSNGHSQLSSIGKIVVYFWQGRKASKMGWLQFTFMGKPSLEAEAAKMGLKLEIIKIHQQQEDFKFLLHFKRKFIIHQGKRVEDNFHKPLSLYQVRSNRDPITLRCIEIEPDSSRLHSGNSFILRSIEMPPSNGSVESNHQCPGVRIFVWIGSKSNSTEAQIAEQMSREKFSLGSSLTSVQVFNEGYEPPEFWALIGGRKEYETDATFMHDTRLFRCSNDKGYFYVSERHSDFCQDDLSDDDIMILDNGAQVFLWVGPNSSEVEIKLAFKSAQVYVQNLRLKDPNSRQLMLTFKGKETKKFTKCFHAWTDYLVLKDPRGDEAMYLRQTYEAEQALARQ